MLLSFNIEYFGECNNVLNFYKSVFSNSTKEVKTYKEMDMAEFFGITGDGLDMVWESALNINLADGSLCFEMSDALMVAMKKEAGMKSLLYSPVICIQCNDDEYVHSLFKKLYVNNEDFESLQNGNVPDKYGIKWQHQKGAGQGIYYSLTFDGFCSDVLSFYQEAFNIKATEVVKYRNSPYGDSISGEGLDMIYSAVLEFKNGDNTYGLKLSDSLESAVKGLNSYDKNALLFYQGFFNPVFTLKGKGGDGLKDAFAKLMEGGKANRLLSPKDGAVNYGSLIDKYGICWNIYEECNG